VGTEAPVGTLKALLPVVYIVRSELNTTRCAVLSATRSHQVALIASINCHSSIRQRAALSSKCYSECRQATEQGDYQWTPGKGIWQGKCRRAVVNSGMRNTDVDCDLTGWGLS